MIAIVNYGVGNLFSLCSSLGYLGLEAQVTDDAEVMDLADQIILPGVGAFGDAADQLRASGMDKVVLSQAAKGKPLLGICVGMQLLYESSVEYGLHQGLGLIPGQVVNLKDYTGDPGLKIPQIGWNSLQKDGDCPLLKYTSDGAYVYYVHSYFAPASGDTAGHSLYGEARITGVVQRDNVYGTQFHPEKSGAVGLDILRAFSEISQSGGVENGAVSRH